MSEDKDELLKFILKLFPNLVVNFWQEEHFKWTQKIRKFPIYIDFLIAFLWALASTKTELLQARKYLQGYR